MAADVVGYSRLMSEDEEGTLRTFRIYRKVIDGLIDKHGGRIFNTAGDAVLAEFDSAVECVRCTISVQEELKTRNSQLPTEKRIDLRIGVNVGDVMIEGEDLFGDGVNIAARLEGLAQPGGVCISTSTFEQVKNKVSIGFEDMGPQEVKNIPHSVGAFQIMSGPVSVLSHNKKSRLGKAIGDRKIHAIVVVIILIMSFSGYFFYWRVIETPPMPLSEFPDNFTTDTMTKGEITRLVTGLTIQGNSTSTGNPFRIQVLSKGIAELQWGKTNEQENIARPETGKWWVENNQFCMQFSRFGKGQKRCPRILRQGNKLYAIRGSGERLKWMLTK